MKKRKKIKIDFNFIKWAPFLLAFAILMITIVYATTADQLSLRDIRAIVRLEKPIRITGFRISNATNEGSTSYNEYSYKTIMSGITLPNANSTVTYELEITNLDSIEMGIHDIIGLPSNLEYTISDYTLDAALCDSNNNSDCTLGAKAVIHLIVGYAENGYNSANTIYNLNLEFDFQETIYTARMNGVNYLTIQDAINAAPIDHTPTTITLLKNVYQRIQVWRGNNITLNMPNLVLHNKTMTDTVGDPVIEIFGCKSNANTEHNDGYATLKMINGSIITSANQAAINVENCGNFIMTGGRIITNGNRQAVYVKAGGTAEISGNSYLKSTAEIDKSKNNYRATVQAAGGDLLITGGTIEASTEGVGSGYALTNESRTTIGTKDGTSNATPIIKGINMGLYIKNGTAITNFYDGVIMSQTATPINNENLISDIEDDYMLAHAAEEIDGVMYDTVRLGEVVTVTFDATTGGTPSEASRSVLKGGQVGTLPTATKSGYIFDGWYTEQGVEVTPTTVINENVTFVAHWVDASTVYVAEIVGGNMYNTLAAAISNATNNTAKTIRLLRNTSERVTIGASKIIILDLGQYKITNPDNNGIITNNGTLTLISGTIENTGTAAAVTNNKTFTMTGGRITTTSNNNAAVNNKASATFDMSGGEIIATGLRQAAYNETGTMYISGTAYLSSTAKVESSNSRGTVQNLANSTIEITGGTIVSTAANGIAFTNLGTATVGNDDGNISTTSPVFRGTGSGIKNTGTLNIYDGILRSSGSSPLSGNYTSLATNSEPVTGTETINGVTYNTWYLQSTS